ncbi:MAG: hypothetical protein M3O32_01960 [Actinomycetota bacterium]|nr:hypothetical protein [Actinomycetota bacterium]
MCGDSTAEPGLTAPSAFTLALLEDIIEVLDRHGYPAPTGTTLADLTSSLCNVLHPWQTYRT